jgi:type II secretory ATPase GspE/PulE/Tfp pilus assembly ATPase PilB-like protein
MMPLDDDIRKLILANADAVTLSQTARSHGMRTLQEDGVEKMLAGLTSPEEIVRVTQVF